jgi:hypothetical protein
LQAGGGSLALSFAGKEALAPRKTTWRAAVSFSVLLCRGTLFDVADDLLGEVRPVARWPIPMVTRPSSSEACGNRVWVTPTVKNGNNVDDRFFDPVVDRKWKPLRQFSVQAENGRVYSRFPLKAVKILEKAIREVVTEAFALLLVEPSTFQQIVAGFNPKLDAHRSLP